MEELSFIYTTAFLRNLAQIRREPTGRVDARSNGRAALKQQDSAIRCDDCAAEGPGGGSATRFFTRATLRPKMPKRG